ncbi:2-oxoacid:acceptor oxidoreductase subunit alpha [Methanolobus bombayensis]|uniref:2-oxoacid:acceptor oxidoreductase subunit alpha n=1 Tax=Methanolobus bombayensis TaxID=38023 RepID=UPI001AE2ADA5|nr:2-oxoacid:acceptor oxidoreductase subunit alpha [Methanolobus bombayensis]MBP1908727.1 2-oxoglutarate ferredoxin oxidoreductase subunit alpha [Methanolobus bombayensis]
MNLDLNIKIGGAAGQGLQTTGMALAKTLKKSGFHVFATQYYLSRVRGGHNTFNIRISDIPVSAMTEDVDLLLALDEATIDQHLDEINDGVVLVDADAIKVNNSSESIFHVPMLKIAKDVCGDKIYSNSVSMGAVIGLLCLDISDLEEILKLSFKKKGEEIIQKNIKAAKAGYDYVKENYPGGCKFAVDDPGKKENLMLINGNQAVGLGALAGGLQFLAAYPMTPSTGVMTYVAANADKFNTVVEQAEDEIAALNMVLGASFTGVRSMVTTSGGGFALMTEALGLAGITETPAVIFLCQRPGPATGLPTMTEQGDLQFVLTAAQGEFPRCILAPGTPEECFYMTAEAFNIADKYQIPVFVMSDQYLADSLFTLPRFDSSKITIERHLLSDQDLRTKKEEYKRYKLTPMGISPRALPGQEGVLVLADSDEHDEYGHICEDAINRIKMNDKRMKKLEVLREEMPVAKVYGKPDANVSLIGWGSTYGPLAEVVDILKGEGKSVNMVHFTHIHPLPVEATKKLFSKTKKTVCVENNSTGQFARHLKLDADLSITDTVLRYDGKPFSPEFIIAALKEKEVI